MTNDSCATDTKEPPFSCHDVRRMSEVSGMSPTTQRLQPIDREMSPTAQAYFEEGERLSLDGSFWEAVAQYDRALKLEPDVAFLWWRKGDCLAQLGQSEATQCWETAARLDPYYGDELVRLRGY